MYPKTFFADEHRPVPQNGTCFVLMPFAHQFLAVYTTIVVALEGDELGFSCKRADDFVGGGHIIEDILMNIGSSEIVIADLTTKNANVFYELGITHMVKDVRSVIIITQQIDDVPFDLQSFRCITYQQDGQGLQELKRDLIEAVKAVASRAYKFSVEEGKVYEFPIKIMGKGRYLYDFRIPGIYTGGSAAKLQINVTRHALQEPPSTSSEVYGLMCGESIPMRVIPFSLKLEKVEERTAYFVLVPDTKKS
jgi:hypothetical protein